MSKARQLPLALAPRPALGREDFLVTPCNADAVAWIDQWPDWPAPALVVHGPPGCGKTHLANVFASAVDAVWINVADLARRPADQVIGAARAGVIDTVEGKFDPAVEEGFFHLYNILRESSRSMLICAPSAPSRWTFHLADLRSRLCAAPAVAIKPPDDLLMEAVLVKLFSDRQLRIDPGVLAYLMPRMMRSFDGARRLVAALDSAALAERRRLTIPLVRQVLEQNDKMEEV